MRANALEKLVLTVVLVAAGAASVVRAGLAMDALALIGVVACLAGWRVLVVARHREHSSD